jgi:hypothetical protein
MACKNWVTAFHRVQTVIYKLLLRERDGIEVMGVCVPWSTNCHEVITNKKEK